MKLIWMVYSFLSIFRRNKQSFCFIAGAEPTVNVRGSGIGGRSQQLALRSALELAVRSREVGHEKFTGAVSGVLFAGGTDGIDGPTDACGAMAHCNTIGKFVPVRIIYVSHSVLYDHVL